MGDAKKVQGVCQALGVNQTNTNAIFKTMAVIQIEKRAVWAYQLSLCAGLLIGVKIQMQKSKSNTKPGNKARASAFKSFLEGVAKEGFLDSVSPVPAASTSSSLAVSPVPPRELLSLLDFPASFESFPFPAFVF